jgi:hypothetical protein
LQTKIALRKRMFRRNAKNIIQMNMVLGFDNNIEIEEKDDVQILKEKMAQMEIELNRLKIDRQQ